jgi:hypothetical protein
MTLIDWNQIFGDRVDVDFSSLEIPDVRDEFDRNVAQLRVGDAYILDIAWNNEEREYVITLFRDAFENPISQECCANPSDVIQRVSAIVDFLGNNSPHFASASQVADVQYA